jgi:hypothetical protein
LFIERFRAPKGAEFHLAGLGGSVRLLSIAAHEFLCAERNPCSIHPEIQSLRQRKRIQWFGVHAFIFSDLFSQILCSSLYLLGIHRHTGQFGQQVATFLEADHGPDGADHAHDSRRE